MKKILLPLLLVLSIAACKKDSSSNKSKQIPLGYDHTTPQGKLLEKLAEGSNKKLTAINYVYYDSKGNLIGSYAQGVLVQTFLMFDDGLTLNPDYEAVAHSSGNCPIIDDTGSDVVIDNGVDYLYYQPDIHQGPTSEPGTVQKVQFTLSDDLITLVLKFEDDTPGSDIDADPNTFKGVTVNYSKRIREYTFMAPH